MSIREKLSVIAAGTIKPFYPFTPVESLYYNKSGVQGPLENYQSDNTGEVSLNNWAPNSQGNARIFNTDKLLTNIWLELQFEPIKGINDNAGKMFYGYDAIEHVTYRIGGEERQTFYGYNMPFRFLQELTKDPEKYKTFYKISGPMTTACIAPTYTLGDPATSSTLSVTTTVTPTVAGYNRSGTWWQGEMKAGDITAGTSKWDTVHVLMPLPENTVGNRYINGIKPLPNYMTDKGLQIDVKFASNPVRTITNAKIRYTYIDTYKDDELKQVVYKYPYKHYYDDVQSLPKNIDSEFEYTMKMNSFKYGEVTQLMLRVESKKYVPFPGCSSKFFGVPLKDIVVECNNNIIYKAPGHSYPVSILDSSDGIMGEVRPIYVHDTALESAYNGATKASLDEPSEEMGKRGYYYVIPLAPVMDVDSKHDYSMGLSLLSKTLVVKFKLAADLEGTAWDGISSGTGNTKKFGPATDDSTLRCYTQTSYNAILQFDGRNVKFQT